ncbi:MAG: S1 family peptidase, partial [Bacteroidota bacterium]|nr:S1 family peptidase [Bacteroidota bacterium]
DKVVQMDNIIKGMNRPKELLSLKSSNSITIRDEDDNLKIFDLSNTRPMHDDEASALKNNTRNIIYGLPGKESGKLSTHDVQKAKKSDGTTKAHNPTWSDIIYSPKISAGVIVPSLRRLNGRRVKPHYVFGNDDRQTFYPSGYPWQCIGRVFVWTDPSNPNWSWSGSAALVTHNTILTAGHVAPWGANSWKVLFVPAYYNGSSTLGAGVLSYVESYWGYNTNDHVAAWDYCVMKLYDPLGDSLGWLGSKTYDGGWNDGNYWTLVGYPGAVASAEQPSWQGGISFHDDDEDGDAMELETDNGDSSPGDSGGPIFAWWDDGSPYIVGVISGEEEEYQFPFSSQDNNIAAAGSPMVDLINWAWSNWP